MSAALRCHGVVVAPAGAVVLRGVDLAVPAGERMALVGPSGAGKTTLLRAIAGLEPLTAGSVELGGRSLRSLPAHRRGVAVVFQEPRLLPHLDVADNVALPLRAAGSARHSRRRQALDILDRVGLGGMGDRGVRGLSGGEQQRVALARALVAEPELLLLDEPLAAVDPNRRESLRRLIAVMQAERALTTLVVTHDRSEAAELGQSVALMLEGRIVQQGEARDLFERPRSAAIARFFGAANLLRGEVRNGLLHCGLEAPIAVDGPDGPACYVLRPEAVRVAPTGELRAVVGEALYSGTHIRLRLVCGERTLEARVAATTRVAAGDAGAIQLASDALWRLPDEDLDQHSSIS